MHGLCAKTCPVNHPVELRTPLRACAAVSRDEADLMSSASGGASSLLAQETLRRGGIVYGCAMESYRDIRHVRIDRAEDAWKIKGSKYVQSRIGEIYKQVRADLQAGREVMFSGTPCQVAGLRNYLRKAYPNLLLVDLVCHGVPSQKLLRDNIQSVLAESGVAVLPRNFCMFLAAVAALSGFCPGAAKAAAENISTPHRADSIPIPPSPGSTTASPRRDNITPRRRRPPPPR